MPKSLNENLELLRHTSVMIETEFVKKFHNSILLTMRLSRSERVLLDFLTEEMDDANYISNSVHLKKRFNDLLVKIGQKKYTKGTINRCFNALCDYELLIKEEERSLYQVNPLFFFKGTQEDREKLIRKQLEKINKEAINKHRRELIIQKALCSNQKESSD